MGRFSKFSQRKSNFDVFFLLCSFLMRGGRFKYHLMRTIIDSPGMALRWRADDGPALNAGLIAL